MSEQKTDFIKIRVFLPVDPEKHFIKRHIDNKLIGNPEYIEMFYDADARFRDPIITFINDTVGLHNWAIKFVQFDDSGYNFDARIYAPDHDDFIKVCGIIRERIKDIQFNYWYRGTIANYIQILQ